MDQRLLNKRVISRRATLIFLRVLFAGVAATVMILGIFKLSELELTESEVYFGAIQVMTFAGVLIAFAFMSQLLFQHTAEPTP
jgi:hypothetical protein